jgi:hypothetical protein
MSKSQAFKALGIVFIFMAAFMIRWTEMDRTPSAYPLLLIAAYTCASIAWYLK